MSPRAIWIFAFLALAAMFPCKVNAQYGSPHAQGFGQQQPQSYLDQLSDVEIEKYLSKWKVYGVRPSRAAFLAIRYYGKHGKVIINTFGEDGLAVLGKVSGTSAITLHDLVPELKQVRQIYPLLRLIAQHPEADRIVELLKTYRQELANSAFVAVLLKRPDAVLALGPLVRMPEIIALHQEPSSPATLFKRTGSWFESFGANSSEVDREKRSKQIADGLLVIFVVAVFGALFWQMRKKFNGQNQHTKVKLCSPPRIEHSPGRPKPAFMVQRDRNNGA